MDTLRSRQLASAYLTIAALMVVVATGCTSKPPARTKRKPRPPAPPVVNVKPIAPVATAPEKPRDPIPPEASMIGTNLACAEFGHSPGSYGKAYTYPGPSQFDYCKKKGMLVIRLPFKWERLQHDLMKPFDHAELKRLDDVVAMARERGLKLLLDVHNYARGKGADGKGHVIGTREVPNAAFADLWKRLARRYKDNEGVFAYGLMNEPHSTNGLWPAAAQAAIDAIRTVDMKTCIFVCGDSWGGAHSWLSANKDLILKDPANNLVYEAHQYFDRDCSGSYKRSYDDSGAHPEIGVQRLQPFVTWLKRHNLRGFIGEFGVPDNDPRWLVVLDKFMAAMKKEGIGGTYWASGPWWGGYSLSLEPRDGKDRPQMAVMEQYVGARNRPSDKPWEKAAAKMEAGRAQRATERSARVAAQPRQQGSKMVHDFAAGKESYHYTNPGSTYASASAQDGGAACRKVTYKHVGNPSWLGVGHYFGNLKCAGYAKFVLEIRSDKNTRLEVKAYRTDSDKYVGHFDVGTSWRRLELPFAALKNGNKTFAGAGALVKIEFQPGADGGGNSIYLRRLELAP